MSLDISFEIAFIALIGGRGSIAGPVLGALLLRPVSDFSRIYFGSTVPGLHLIIFGVVLILVMLFQPRGLQEPLTRIYKKGDDTAFRRQGGGGMKILELQKVRKSFGGIKAVEQFSLSVEEGEIVGLIGPTAPANPPCLTVSRSLPADLRRDFFLGEKINGQRPWDLATKDWPARFRS
jgi:hypothetical protein